MSPGPDPAPADQRAAHLLGSLAGILSAHVAIDDDGRIVEIHVLSTPDLHPKQVVRNVESALSAGLGLQIDRRVVSVAQMRAPSAGSHPGPNGGPDTAPANGAAAPATAPARPPVDPDDPTPDSRTTVPRLEFVRFESRRDIERCTCDVVLRSEDREIHGSGAGPDTAAGRAEAAARAVFDAVAEARPDLRLALDGAAISASRGREFVIVSGHLLRDRDSLPLAGAAHLARSPEEAAILAALQATNRWSS